MGETSEVPQQEQVGIAVKRDESPKVPELEKPPLDALLVFGQGPVVERETRERASDVEKEQGSEDVNLWSKTLAEAAFELYKRGQTREIIIMGGQTGGEVYQSEAELIAKILVEQYSVPKDAIKLEKKSGNTLENIVNLLNDHIDAKEKYKNIGMLTSNFHLSRVRLLMELFGIPYKHAFSAEEVLRYVAREGGAWETWNQQQLLEIERGLDMGQVSKTPVSEADKRALERYDYYQTKAGTERKSIVRRGQEEDIWSRALLEMPEYWLPYVGRLDNTEGMRAILAGTDQGMSQDRFGIDLTSDSDESIREKLLMVGRKLPDLEQWIGRGWSSETTQKLERLIEERKKSLLK